MLAPHRVAVEDIAQEAGEESSGGFRPIGISGRGRRNEASSDVRHVSRSFGPRRDEIEGIPAVRFRRTRRKQKHPLADGRARRADLGPHLALYVEGDQRAAPFEGVREHEADALACARRPVHIDVARAAVAHVLTVEAPEEDRVAGPAVQQIRLS